jgi:hypothetical protein
MFGELAKSESLRDLIVALETHWRKLHHLGMDKSITQSNLTKANEQRNHKIFEKYCFDNMRSRELVCRPFSLVDKKYPALRDNSRKRSGFAAQNYSNSTVSL